MPRAVRADGEAGCKEEAAEGEEGGDFEELVVTRSSRHLEISKFTLPSGDCLGWLTWSFAF